MSHRLSNRGKAHSGRLVLFDFVFDHDAQTLLFLDEDRVALFSDQAH